MGFTERFDAATAKMDELKARMGKASDEINESCQQGAAKFRSDMDVLRASLREIAESLDEQNEVVSEKREAKVEEARAKLEATADKIYEIGQSFERADQEELIVDLLTYAEECQDLADMMADEAELALKAAAEQIAIYNEKFGG